MGDGVELDPIKAAGFNLIGFGRIIYDVGDGNHRCVARERNGEKFIQADVGGIYHINPSRLCIYKRMVWKAGEDGSMNCISCDHLDEHLLKQIEKLGIRRL